MDGFTLEELNTFIVHAKAATYVGGGTRSLSYRPGSHDLQFHEGSFTYLDSYFGGADFIGQEVVYFEGQPVWAMNYYGRILEPARIEAQEAGQVQPVDGHLPHGGFPALFGQQGGPAIGGGGVGPAEQLIRHRRQEDVFEDRRAVWLAVFQGGFHSLA